MELETVNEVSAAVGDQVAIELEPSKTVLYALMAFGIPLAGAIGGYAAGMAIIENQNMGVAGSFTGIALALALLWAGHTLWPNGLQSKPRIVEISKRKKLLRVRVGKSEVKSFFQFFQGSIINAIYL